ncbi:(rap annotation release2) galactose-binding like domain containing protein [Citrus sinensis]|uniref:(Rap annotation release2) galactose-binding like domain containing protein n=1 Tax=Citrus sinensis TaxID=2711 RepID=A0ACB8L5Y1_CITSI|nr:(rap annotation release2) galactose-binding like domain containing protein [Citrus sinensis]
MSLPASQYSVLDAERIERVDDNTFRCYVYRFKFFAFEICPVLLVRVEEQPNGCCIKLLSCKLEGSPIVVAQNDKFDASMINRISCDSNSSNSEVQQLTSDAFIEVSIEVPFAFRAFPVEAIESTGTQVLDQILKLMLPRFMSQGESVTLEEMIHAHSVALDCWPFQFVDSTAGSAASQSVLYF